MPNTPPHGKGIRAQAVTILRLLLVGSALPAFSAIAETGPFIESVKVIEAGRFSAAQAGGPFPSGWKPMIITKTKKKTAYSLVTDNDTVVVMAVADASASGLIREIQIDPKEYPIVQWRWKASSLVAKADNHRRDAEDSPVRLMVSFQGDVGKLGFKDRALFQMTKLVSGEELPYATLSYIWENRAPKDTVIPSPHTKRIQMIVVESGAVGLNQWLTEERNVYEDYKRAFGEEPPMISAVGIMTDTDNTGQQATAYYGDIVFRRGRISPPEWSDR